MEDFVCKPVFRVSKLQSFPQRVMSDGPVCLTFLEWIYWTHVCCWPWI